MRYNLVCTKVEDIDSTIEDLLLLDHFCLNDFVGNYLNKKYNIANPYGYDEELMKNDFNLTKKLVNSLTIELSQILNETHKINFSIRQWQILLSFWLHLEI